MNKIKEARKAAGLSQKYVAMTLGIAAPSVSNWESGKTQPTPENLKALAELLGVSVDYLLGRDDLQHASHNPIEGNIHVTGNFGQGKSKLAAESAQAFQQLDPDRTRYAEQLRAREHFGPTYQPKDQITVTATGPDGVTQQLMHEAVHDIGQKPLTPAEEAEQIRQDLIAKLRSMRGDKLVRISQYADLLKQQEDMEKEAKRNELR